jgi:hypothetical protein
MKKMIRNIKMSLEKWKDGNVLQLQGKIAGYLFENISN